MSGGFSESGASHNHPELYPRSHCRSNPRTVVLYPFCWDPRLPHLVIVSLTLSFCFFRVSLSCFRRDHPSPSSLDIALRMIYPHNPQSIPPIHLQHHSSPSSSGPSTEHCSPPFFRCCTLCSPSRFLLYGLVLICPPSIFLHHSGRRVFPSSLFCKVHSRK